ncbi:unnamed protein product [Boreogadus saida]
MLPAFSVHPSVPVKLSRVLQLVANKINLDRQLAWANKEVETFVCILGEEDVVYDVYVAAAAIDIRPTTKGTVGSGNATSELSWANRSLPTAPLRSDPFRTLQWKCGIILPQSTSAQRPSLVLQLFKLAVDGGPSFHVAQK